MPFQYPNDFSKMEASLDKDLYSIYELHDNSGIRYIGKVKNNRLPQRYYRHTSIHEYNLSKMNPHKKNWLLKLNKNNQKPLMMVIEYNISNEKAIEREIYYISYHKSIGTKLINKTEGGEGTVGYKPTEETKKKLAKASKGRKASKETREKISNANKGKKRSPLTKEHKKKISISLIGKRHWTEKEKETHSIKLKRIHKVLREKNPDFGKKTYTFKETCKKAKPIIQLDKETQEPLAIFLTTKYAAEIVDVPAPTITICLKQNKGIRGGYKWKYAKDLGYDIETISQWFYENKTLVKYLTETKEK